MNKRPEELIAAFLDHSLEEEQMRELTSLLKDDPAVREKFRSDMRMQVLMRELAVEEKAAAEDIPIAQTVRPRGRSRRKHGFRFGPLLGLAACVAMVIGLVLYFQDETGSGGQSSSARLASLEGAVQLQRGDSQQIPAIGDPIRDGDILRSGPDGMAGILYDDATLVSLDPLSLMTVSGGSKGKNFKLETGRLMINASSQPAGRPLQVISPHAEIIVKGTRFTVKAESGWTRTAVEEGQVTMVRKPDRNSIDIPAGYYAIAGEGLELKLLPAAGTAPRIILGTEKAVTELPDAFQLPAADIMDPDIPAQPLTLKWTLKEGPAPVIFSDPGLADPTVRFSKPGSYALGLTADDGKLTSEGVVQVLVLPEKKRITYTSWLDNSGPGMGTDIIAGAVRLKTISEKTGPGSIASAKVDGPEPLGSHIRLTGELVMGPVAGIDDKGSPYAEFHGGGNARLLFYADGRAVLESRYVKPDGKRGPFILHASSRFNPKQPASFLFEIDPDSMRVEVNGKQFYKGPHHMEGETPHALVNLLTVRTHPAAKIGRIGTFRKLEVTVNPDLK